jgi:hypothetical protein
MSLNTVKFIAYNSIERIVQKEENMEMCGLPSEDKFFVKSYVKEQLTQVVGPLTLCYAEALAQDLASALDCNGNVRYSKIEVVEK